MKVKDKGKNRTKDTKKLPTFIYWAKIIRPRITQENRGKSLGQVSSILAQMWRTMPDAEKSVWKEKCQKNNQEIAERVSEENAQDATQQPSSVRSDQQTGNHSEHLHASSSAVQVKCHSFNTEKWF